VPAAALASALAARATSTKHRMIFDVESTGRCPAACKWRFHYTYTERIISHVRPGAWVASADVASGFIHYVIDMPSREEE
jgi:hypothetical protein